MRSMAGLLSLLVGVCSVGAGGERQEPSKWVVGLQAPLRSVYEETNERGQVLQLGERQISFRLTQPADSVVVEVLFVTYAGSGGEVYKTFEVTPDDPYPSSSNRVSCGHVAIWRHVFHTAPPESALRVTWDYVWDEELARQRTVAGWGVEAYGGGLTKEDLPRRLGTVHHTSYRYPLTCREWLPDPYQPNEIWGTWRHDERGRVVRGRYHIKVQTWDGAEHESTTSSGIGLHAENDTVQPAEVLESAEHGAEEAFWGWYSIPGGHWEAAFEETKRIEEEKRNATEQGGE